MVLRRHSKRGPVSTGALLVCILAAAGCGGPKEPPIPPGMVRVGDKPLEINTPPLVVKARISSPFPEEEEQTVADELDAALRDMGLDLGAEAPEEEPRPAVIEPVPEVLGGPETAPTKLEKPKETPAESAKPPADTAKEVAALRTDVARMQAMLDLVLEEFVIQLKNENNRLREEAETLRHELESGNSQNRPVLMGSPQSPGPTLPPAPEADTTPPVDYEEVAEPAGAGPIRYAVIREWGRNASEAARMNNASTLKGLICAVPPDATDTQLAELGRWFRGEYEEYENINIDVFDDVVAARSFAYTNRMEGHHRVLNISKHPSTNLDVIALIRKDGTTVIPREETP